MQRSLTLCLLQLAACILLLVVCVAVCLFTNGAGDDGSQGIGNSNTINGTVCNYNTNYWDASGPKGPSPEFPAISPYVLAVGGTEFSSGCPSFSSRLSGSTSPICSGLSVSQLSQYGIKYSTPYPSFSFNCLNPNMPNTEVAVSLSGSGYTSGGGFSRYFTRSSWAPWQDSVVNGYLSSSGSRPSAALFNRSGRAIPDVAMYGSGFPIVVGGALQFLAGTSLSAPLFAGVIALLNQQTLAARGATIGFAAPLMYSIAAKTPAAFTDITSGDNLCPEGAATCPRACQGYSAVAGWDPVTGLGVPNIGAMQEALSNYLYLTNPTHTGSVTGITGSSYSAAASVVCRPALVAVLLLVVSVVSLLL